MFKDILVGVDESAQSRAALDLALDLATALGSSLTLVHVVDAGRLASTVDAAAATTIEIELDELETAGKGLLDEAAARAAARGIAATPMLRDGPPAATILDTAKRSAVDLIVLGTHARSGVARFFLGSTAESVLRESTIPVLVRRG